MKSALHKSFARAAGDYRKHARVQSALADWLVEWLPVERTGRALEVGAGPGVFTQRLLPWNGGLTATDLSPDMCAAGRSALPQVNWQTMSAEAPLAGPWQWIFCSSMLQWAGSPGEVFAAWRDQLAPGGRVLAGLFVSGSLPELQALAGGSAPLTWRAPEEWRGALVRGGLRVLRDEAETRVFEYPSARDFLHTLHGVGATPERRFASGGLRRLLREYEERFDAGSGVRATWTFYRFEAERME